MEIVFSKGVIALAALFWVIVAAGAGIAVYSRRIEDTVLERIGLVGIALGAAGTAWRVQDLGYITEGGIFIGAALAFYVTVIFWKHYRDVRGSSRDKK